MRKNSTRNYTFIDLFAGCGGLREGFYRKGFTALAHVEINKFACDTLRERMRSYGYANPEKEVVEHNITAADIINRIDDAVDGRIVDVIIGGPPCQAYSTAGRAREIRKQLTLGVPTADDEKVLKTLRQQKEADGAGRWTALSSVL